MDQRRAINDMLFLPGVLLNNHTDDEGQIIRAYRDMYRGRVDRDTDLLDELLDDGYTLTHMTGYRQSRAEWLEQVNTGEMRYHDFQERDVTVRVTGDTAVLVGRNIVHATIWATADPGLCSSPPITRTETAGGSHSAPSPQRSAAFQPPSAGGSGTHHVSHGMVRERMSTA